MTFEEYQLPDVDGRRIAFLVDTDQPARVKKFLVSLGPQFETEDAIFLSGFGLAISPGPITAAFANMKNFNCNCIKSLKESATAIPGSYFVVIIGNVDEQRLAKTVSLLEDADVEGRTIEVCLLSP